MADTDLQVMWIEICQSQTTIMLQQVTCNQSTSLPDND